MDERANGKRGVRFNRESVKSIKYVRVWMMKSKGTKIVSSCHYIANQDRYRVCNIDIWHMR
jgi:hypothetical protein